MGTPWETQRILRQQPTDVPVPCCALYPLVVDPSAGVTFERKQDLLIFDEHPAVLTVLDQS